MLVAYLVAFWSGVGGTGGAMGEYYFLFTVICGILPDFDIILLPFNRRWYMLRHHGITHTLVFIVGAAITGSLLLWWWYGMNPAILILTGLMGGGMHLLGDYYSNYSIPLTYPFGNTQHKLDIDMAVNPWLLLFSSPTVLTLWYFRSIGLDYGLYVTAVTLASLVFLSYIVARFAFKRVAGVRVRRALGGRGGRIRTLPTMSPRRWNVVVDCSTPERYRVIYGRWDIFSSHKADLLRFSLPRNASGQSRPINGKGVEPPTPKERGAFAGSASADGADASGEPRRLRGRAAEEALAVSREDPKVRGSAQNIRFPVASVWGMPDGTTDVFWHSAEFYSPRRSFGVRVTLADGRIISSRRGLGPS